jgi:hypothetical protein
MRVIAAGLHRMLDFVTVAGFALAPSVLGLRGLGATLAYVLAAVHLALTLLTHFPGSAARPVSLLVHGAIEGVVGIALLLLPWLLGWSGTTRTFYVVAGAVILAVWVLSAYRTTTPSSSV